MIKRWRSTEAVLQRAVSELTQAASGRQLPSSFGLSCVFEHATETRDRAARLRSSDAVGAEVKLKRERQPDAKNRDVVAVQLLLF